MSTKKYIVVINIILTFIVLFSTITYAYDDNTTNGNNNSYIEVEDSNNEIITTTNDTNNNSINATNSESNTKEENTINNVLIENTSNQVNTVTNNSVNNVVNNTTNSTVNTSTNNAVNNTTNNKTNNVSNNATNNVVTITTDKQKGANNTINSNVNNTVSNNVVKPENTSIRLPEISYSTHVENIGWQAKKYNGELAGTEGKSLRLEAIKINLNYALGGIQYQTHVQNIGWQAEKSNGQLSGTEGKSLRVEAIRIKLSGDIANQYSVIYRVHAQNYGWLGWAKDGETAGTEGYGLRLEAIEIKLIDKGDSIPSGNKAAFYRNLPTITYRCHVQNIGWEGYSTNCKCIGTIGRGLRLEALQMSIGNTSIPGSIEYSTHIQNIGWQDFKKSGSISGTQGKSLRIEAIKIRLTGELAQKYDIYYRAHCQNVGWLDWTKNGEVAGTTGFSYRLEAIHIVLVEKNKPSPGSMIKPYTANVKGLICIDNPIQTHIGVSNNSLKIDGWALSTSINTTIKVYIDGKEVNDVKRIKREDVIKAYPAYAKNNPTSGYITQIDFSKLTNMKHVIRVVLYDTQQKCVIGEASRDFVKYKDLRLGIDVSRHNSYVYQNGQKIHQRIDWAKVKDQIDFAIVRCGYGQNLDENGGYLQDDDEFIYNMNECKKYNIPVEVYLYSYADSTKKASSEADHVLRLCKNYKNIVHMIWYDVEDDYLFNQVKSGKISKDGVGKIVDTFAEKLMVNGYKVGLYSYKSALQSYFSKETIDKYDIWLAHYVSGVNQQNVLKNMSSYPGTYVMWQYTSSGTITGISTSTDLNIRFVDFY